MCNQKTSSYFVVNLKTQNAVEMSTIQHLSKLWTEVIYLICQVTIIQSRNLLQLTFCARTLTSIASVVWRTQCICMSACSVFCTCTFTHHTCESAAESMSADTLSTHTGTHVAWGSVIIYVYLIWQISIKIIQCNHMILCVVNDCVLTCISFAYS